MFDIKKYFGRRGSEQKPTPSDNKIIKTMSLGGLRPESPKTTTFNRNMVIGLVGLFTVVFAFGLLYGIDDPGAKKKAAEEAEKNKKISNAPVNGTQLDKLPSTYDKTKNNGMIYGANNTVMPLDAKGQQQTAQTAMPPGQSVYSTPPAAAPRQAVSYSSPPIPASQGVNYSAPPAAPRPPVASSQPAGNYSVEAVAAKAVERALQEQAEARKRELQEQAEARKSLIRFNVK